MSSSWVSLKQSDIFTRLKYGFSSNIKDLYEMGSGNFSTTDNQNKKAIFPFVYVWFMPSSAKDIDLERASVQSMDFSVQIEVYDNKTPDRAKKVANECLRVMADELSFLPKPVPYFENQGDIYRMVSRYYRTIDWNDIL